MGDAGEGLIDSESRIQERMEELAREKRSEMKPRDTRAPEQVQAVESLRLARIELSRQLTATSHDGRRAQLTEALAEVDRRMVALNTPVAASPDRKPASAARNAGAARKR